MLQKYSKLGNKSVGKLWAEWCGGASMACCVSVIEITGDHIIFISSH